jgi:site-specific recombinase XerD
MTEVKTAWRALLKTADIKNFRWHDLRHSFASSLVQAGVDLNTVRELLTHSDMKMTMRYAHLALESKLNAVQALNRRTKGDKIIGRIRKLAS